MSDKQMTSADWYREFAKDLETKGFIDSNDYEVKSAIGGGWSTQSTPTLLGIAEKDPTSILRKPRSITISGPGGTHSYLEPMCTEPAMDTLYFVPSNSNQRHVVHVRWTGSEIDHTFFRRGKAHLDKEAACEHAKAEIRAAGYTP